MNKQTSEVNKIYLVTLFVFFFLLILFVLIIPTKSEAMPVFARKYNMSCVACHAAFPRLNEFGEQFVSDNYRLPNWKESTVETGDEMLALPDSVPLALRYPMRRLEIQHS